MAQVTNFAAIDAALSDIDGLGAAVDAIEAEAAGEFQLSYAYRARYQLVKRLAERLAKLTSPNAHNPVKKLVEYY